MPDALLAALLALLVAVAWLASPNRIRRSRPATALLAFLIWTLATWLALVALLLAT